MASFFDKPSPPSTQSTQPPSDPISKFQNLTIAPPVPSITSATTTTPLTPEPTTPSTPTFTKPGQSHYLQQTLTISNNTSEIFSVKFNPSGTYLAACCGDGSIRVFNTTTGALSYNLQKGSSLSLPCTNIRWRPEIPGGTNTKNVLITADANGCIEHYHVTSGKCLHSFTEENNQVLALDFNSDGSAFATGGKDTVVRIYDESTKQLTTSMSRGAGYGPNSSSGHSNRIFSLKYHPTDNNCIVSGGWDNTIQIWDVRSGLSVRSLYGPHLCGDSLDVSADGSEILTGSWRLNEALELWDFDTGEKKANVEWVKSEMNECKSMLYAAQFSKFNVGEGNNGFIAAGGSNTNEFRVYSNPSEGGENQHQLIGSITNLTRGVFTLDWSSVMDKVAVAGGDGCVRFVDVVDRRGGGGGKSVSDGVENSTGS